MQQRLLLKILLSVCAQLLCGYLYSQTLFVTLVDSESQEGLVGSYITITERQYVTNEYGRVSIPINTVPKKIDLVATYIGYQPLDTIISINTLDDVYISIRLKSSATLPVVNISVNDYTEDVHSELNRIAPSIASLKVTPSLGGEVDILKSLQLTPGISAGAEGTADLLVRGGSADQNLILLDGAKVYNSNHFFGLISPFQPGLVKAIEVFKGGFPARYGGRLSSVVNVTSIEGRQEDWRGEASLGLINAQANASGPINDKWSLAVGGRSAYLSVLNLLFQQNSNVQTYAFYDINAKATLRTDRTHLSISAFRNHDITQINDDFAQAPVNGNIRYGNNTLSGRWLYNLTGKFDLLSELNFNQYQFGTEQSSLDDNDGIIGNVSLNSTIRETAGRLELRGRPTNFIKVSAGIEYNSRSIAPRDIEDGLTGRNNSFPVEDTRELGLYLEPIIRFSPKTSARLGLRVQEYTLPFGEERKLFFEPRLSVNSKLSGNIQLSSSYARMSQGVHRITSNFIGIPNNLWVSSRPLAPPSQSDIYTVGSSLKMKNAALNVEFFLKRMKDLIDPLPGRNLFQTSTLDWLNEVSTAGEARIYGLEGSWTMNKERWNLTVNYTLSWNQIRYDEINAGQWYFQQFDRRHDLAIIGLYELSDNWSVSANFIFNDGFRLTLPQTVYLDGLFNTPVPFYQGRFDAKSPAYHRLDANFIREVRKANGHYRRLTLGVYNAYARKNATFILHETDTIFDLSGSTSSPELLGISSSARRFTLFRFIPHISYGFSF
jgi:hypothetical protein